MGVQRSRLTSPGREPDPKRALPPVPGYERAVREVSKMLAVESGADRDLLRAAVAKVAPRCADTLEKLFGNVERSRHVPRRSEPWTTLSGRQGVRPGSGGANGGLGRFVDRPERDL